MIARSKRASGLALACSAPRVSPRATRVRRSPRRALPGGRARRASPDPRPSPAGGAPAGGPGRAAGRHAAAGAQRQRDRAQPARAGRLARRRRHLAPRRGARGRPRRQLPLPHRHLHARPRRRAGAEPPFPLPLPPSPSPSSSPSPSPSPCARSARREPCPRTARCPAAVFIMRMPRRRAGGLGLPVKLQDVYADGWLQLVLIGCSLVPSASVDWVHAGDAFHATVCQQGRLSCCETREAPARSPGRVRPPRRTRWLSSTAWTCCPATSTRTTPGVLLRRSRPRLRP